MSDATDNNTPETPRNIKTKWQMPAYWYLDLLMVLVILVGGYLRFTGLQWDENQHLHPDERFLTMVENDISPVQSLAQYFDTDNSSLNPQNRGHGFYVYGTLPIFIVRYLAQWTGQTGYDQVHVLGRQVSGIFDLLTLILVYLIGSRLYNKKVGILAAAFFALAVMQIQISHYFAVDTFVTTFITLSVYFAVRVQQAALPALNPALNPGLNGKDVKSAILGNWGGIDHYLLFGLAMGLAMASKVSAAPVAFLLPVAVLPWYVRLSDEERQYWLYPVIRNFILAAVVAFLTFRVFQPYAFAGPGFFNISLNPKWLDNLRDLSVQTSGAADFPPALQWARRDASFALVNLVKWGMGIPLGILAWAGFLVAAWQMVKKNWQPHLVIWLWTGLYFAWQSNAWNPSMRYMVLVYPTLCIFAAWLVFYLVDQGRKGDRLRLLKFIGYGIGALTLVITALWAFAFVRIYHRPVTRIEASRWIYQNIPGPINLLITDGSGFYNQPLPFGQGTLVDPATPVTIGFTANASGTIDEVVLHDLVDTLALPGEKTISVTLTDPAVGTVTTSQITGDFLPGVNTAESTPTLKFTPGLPVIKGQSYQLSLAVTSGNGAFSLKGSSIANESDWDDGLPLRLDGYDGFGGIYQGDQNFQMYWDENEDKRTRFITTLDNADTILISSNRQWATTVRIPERYPMAALYYRELLGCPTEMDLLKCYEVAQPGMFHGTLGFDLVRVFESDPGIGSFSINDQSAEEAFTVYDHPKVFIFRKSAAYDPAYISAHFHQVDLTKVIHVPLNEVPKHPQDLQLPANRWVAQQTAGTWSQLFNVQALVNQHPIAAVPYWYLAIALLGWIVFPIVRLALPGLADGGYAFARLIGLLLFALISWWLGSLGVTVDRGLLALVLLGITGLSAIALVLQGRAFWDFLKQHKKQILLVELVFLGFFLLDLLIRVGNPDLWHPYKGGEKPMDFSYFNAVIKSATFPPYDPWFAGGYINYYYYGYVIVGLPVKLLGIMPSVAYNLILPTLYALLGAGMFSITWSITGQRTERDPAAENTGNLAKNILSPVGISLLAACGLVLLGNLGTVRMIWHGIQRLAAPEGLITGANFFQRIGWTFKGIGELFHGANLPYGLGDWYWIPSRAIPAPGDVEPITEFPFFTFLYADLHAHMMALPITLLVLGWIVSLVLSRGNWPAAGKVGKIPVLLIGLFSGALAVGALRPTNTWDLPVFLALGLLALGYTQFRWHGELGEQWSKIPFLRNRFVRAAASCALFVVLSFVLYQPFADWYGAAYTSVELWKGTHTPFWSYLTHWGVFLFFIIAWMVGETIDWMAETPLRKLNLLRPYLWLGEILLAALLAVLIVLIILGVGIAWFVLPLAAWAGILLIRPGRTDLKRLVLFLIGTGLLLTLFVEVFVLKGDIGRMNTVFKFYLQVWTLFAFCAALSAWWILERAAAGTMRWLTVFKVISSLLLIGAFLFPLTAGMAKIKDRYVAGASHSLDGMNYMVGATYGENGTEMQLADDLPAIRWMQQNVQGTPVIVEGHVTEYRWGNRFTIYTGLPGVVGWNWHQRQQRGVTPSEWVTDRVAEVADFYNTTSMDAAVNFLRKYNVRYIVVGQLEKAIYTPDGLAKFSPDAGGPWKVVYQQGLATILEVTGE
jgi:YYY domain-containing protein